MSHRVDVADVVVCALAAHIVDGDVTGVGLGTPIALTAALLARATHAPASHVIAGGTFDAALDVSGYLGGPATSKGRVAGYVSHFDSMDMAERQAMTLQFLRPAQIDGTGALNTSRIGPLAHPDVRLPGGLATADVPRLLPRVVAYLPDHRTRNLPDRVAYRTASGAGWPGPTHPTAGVTTVVTDLAVIAFGPSGPRLVSTHPWAGVDEVVARTGFAMETRAVHTTPLPDMTQTAALGRVDPENRRTSEIRTVPEPATGGVT